MTELESPPVPSITTRSGSPKVARLRAFLAPASPAWSLMLAPVLPALALIWPNLTTTSPTSAIRTCIALAGCALVLATVFAFLFHSWRRLCLIAAAAIVLFFNYAELQVRVGAAGLTALALLALIAALMVRLRRHAMNVEAISTVANLFMVLTCGSYLVLIAVTEHQRPKGQPHAVAEPAGAHATPPRPDVYILILDGYGRADVLRRLYGFDNALVADLEQRGFMVAEGASANYSQTVLSLSSLLNIDYVQALLPPNPEDRWVRRELGDLIRDNLVFRKFREAGYRVRVFASEYPMVAPGRADTVAGWLRTPNSFDYVYYEESALPSILSALGVPRGIPTAMWRIAAMNRTLSDLGASVPSGTPTLTFVHVLAPHPPFVFDEDGNVRQTRLPMLLDDASHWRLLAQGSGERYRPGYIAAVMYLNREIIRVIDAIDARTTGTPPVFYIQGDHGPGAMLKQDDVWRSDAVERQSILLAFRGRNGSGRMVPQAVTPVNSLRVLLNTTLGTRFPALSNHSFMSNWDDPLAFIDVSRQIGLVDAAE